MELSVRKPPYLIPSYSLTGDLLSFLRCGLQYRYGTLGRLPATRPVQMWFGQFIHGVLEEAFLRYRPERKIVGEAELEEILDLVARRLAASGLRPRNRDLEEMGKQRARAAVHELGPELFPLISQAEIPLNGTRHLPLDRWPKSLPRRESDRYEMAGIIDVITEVTLDDPATRENPIVSAIKAAIPDTRSTSFEVIVDYKGMRRPPRKRPSRGGPDYWSIYEWQLQTYATLRTLQPDSRPVAAGVLLYLNELRPSISDIAALRREIRQGLTDVYPQVGSRDEKLLRNQGSRGSIPELSFEFRLQRALRIIPITKKSQETAARNFDKVVFDIEIARAKEQQAPRIREQWPKDASDEATCVACDWRTVCPDHRDVKAKLPTESA
ncbi:MAG: PD-(D/E)XK nuclease family protein [Fimbriimonadaceae bacterium]|nr:PD-(D/E)XK nuclease family protein [Fimbriimonadaceae bacterium]